MGADDLESGHSYAEIRALIRQRLAAEGRPEPELLDAFCLAISGVAHERSLDQFLESLPEAVHREGFQAIFEEVREDWEDVVEMLQLATMRHTIAALRRGVPLDACNDAVNHILAREFFGLPKGGSSSPGGDAGERRS